MSVQPTCVSSYRQVLYMFKERLSRPDAQQMVDDDAASKFGENMAYMQPANVTVGEFPGLPEVEQKLQSSIMLLSNQVSQGQ
jgi:hypothetical protein